MSGAVAPSLKTLQRFRWTKHDSQDVAEETAAAAPYMGCAEVPATPVTRKTQAPNEAGSTSTPT